MTFQRTLPMPEPDKYLGKRALKRRILKSLQKLAGAFEHTRKKQAIFDFINCIGGLKSPDRLPYYSADSCPKRKEKAYLFFCFLGELIQAWWKFDAEEDGERDDDTKAIIELSLDRVEDVTKHGLKAYKICGDPTGYWLEPKDG